MINDTCVFLQLLIPLERFLTPDESSVDLIQLYLQAVFSSAVTSRRSPVLYVIAVHHINRFIYDRSDVDRQQLRHWIIRQIMRLQDKVCMSCIGTR